jgi:hypothetical protein
MAQFNQFGEVLGFGEDPRPAFPPRPRPAGAWTPPARRPVRGAVIAICVAAVAGILLLGHQSAQSVTPASPPPTYSQPASIVPVPQPTPAISEPLPAHDSDAPPALPSPHPTTPEPISEPVPGSREHLKQLEDVYRRAMQGESGNP